ncbi:unnamed protein product [Rotaria socialis]|uniref:Uncharacterized protein n=1 Tax=Rotaria socialis TaxID=392032 RepID=A0A818V718_9BILA|nr:unnamed protein product [Rotaria socialis]
MASTNVYDNISQSLVPSVDVYLSMDEYDISYTTIGTRSTGPCFFFLLDFLTNDEQCCYLYHYNFPFDESELIVEKVLVQYLDIIWNSLKDSIERKIVSSEVLEKTKISNFKLVVGGGDTTDGQLLRKAFSLLNNDEMNIASIKWRSPSGTFDIAILQLNCSANIKSQWQLQTKAIQQFRDQCQHDEKLVSEQALLLIPPNPIFTAEIYPVEDRYTFTSANVDKRLDFNEAAEQNQGQNRNTNNDTLKSSIKFQAKSLDEDIKIMPDKEKKHEQINQYEDEFNFDDDIFYIG